MRHVLQAIERRRGPESEIGLVADEIRPVFQSNVGISSWGLAIHSEARVLATSSNLHEVRVFKFGLMQAEDSDHCLDQDEQEFEDLWNGGHRRLDVTQRVLNGNANIPHISFCNTGDDPEARWLLTTDVSGYCRVMDLHTSDSNVTVQQFRFGRSYLGHHGDFDRLNAGWAIMFLDRRSFKPETDFHAALGLQKDEELPGKANTGRLWDLSDTIQNVADNSVIFSNKEPRTRSDSRRSQTLDARPSPRSAQDPIESVADDEMGETTELTAEEVVQPQGNADEPIDLDFNMTTAGVATTLQIDADDYRNMYEDALHEDDTDESGSDDLFDGPNESSIARSLMHDFLGQQDDPDDEGTEDSISHSTLYGGKRLFGNQPYFYHEASLCEGLPCPILHASVKNVYLLQPSATRRTSSGPSNDSAEPFTAPMVGLANPLRQAVQNQYTYLNMFDRLNMHAYIPSLGVVVLASQKGRALVLGLTKLPASTKYPVEIQQQDDLRKRSNYAFRVIATLPFASQEKEHDRPFAPLHGIAVGPMQGTESSLDDFKRWRLMIMYQDHSVLSYEIKRASKRDSAVGVESLVV